MNLFRDMIQDLEFQGIPAPNLFYTLYSVMESIAKHLFCTFLVLLQKFEVCVSSHYETTFLDHKTTK